jgi:membrane associated rhomboid family serine protease
MPKCPVCSTQFDKSHANRSGGVDCDNCDGQAMPKKVLLRIMGESFTRSLNRISRVKGGQKFRKCLSCGTTMDNFSFSNDDDADDSGAVLRICPSCDLAWLDGQTRHELDSMLDNKRQKQEVSSKPQTEVSIDRLFSTARPTAIGLKLLPALLLLPIECSTGDRRRTPIVTWTTATLLLLVLLMTLGFSDWKSLISVVWDWSLLPAKAMRHGGLTFVTSFFLHLGWIHLLGNLYFLLVFGDGLEDDIGWLGFIGVLAAGHLGGMLLQILVASSMETRIVGASAGIAGVLGCYAVLLARTRLGWLVVVPVKWTLVILRIPALAVFAAYAVQQACYAMQSPDAGVAFAAHLGGMATGALYGLLVIHMRNTRDPSKTH